MNKQSAVSSQQSAKKKRIVLQRLTGCWLLAAGCWLPSVHAGQLPSLFRGVVVADGAHGVRVVSVEDTSQAFFADLRPEDIIFQVNGTDIRTIDEFATLSSALKGTAMTAQVLILRHGEPRQLTIHLYSYPVLRQWDLTFVPDDDLRFADGRAGLLYWLRMARGYEEIDDLEAALNAYLNGLHNEPTFLEAAVRVSELLWELAHQHLKARRMPEALEALAQQTRILTRLFEQPLTEEDLRHLKAQLERTIELIRRYRTPT